MRLALFLLFVVLAALYVVLLVEAVWAWWRE
jgi:hypothetical protein